MFELVECTALNILHLLSLGILKLLAFEVGTIILCSRQYHHTWLRHDLLGGCVARNLLLK